MTDLQTAALSILNGLLSNPERCRGFSPMDVVDQAHLIAELFVPYEGNLKQLEIDPKYVNACTVHRDRMWNPKKDTEAKCDVWRCKHNKKRFGNHCEKYECVNNCDERTPKGFPKDPVTKDETKG